MHAVILVGGKGKRLREITQDTEHPIPKCLVPIGDKTVLEHQIDLLKKIGVTNIILCENYLNEVIKKFFADKNIDRNENVYDGIHLEHLVLEEDLESAGAMKEAMKRILPQQQHIFFLYGDIFTNASLEAMLKLHKVFYEKMQPKQKGECLVTILGVMYTHPKGLLRKTSDGFHVNTYEKQKELISGGIFVISREIDSMLPDQGDFTRDVLDKLPAQNKIVYEHNGKWRDIGTMLELREARNEWQQRHGL